MATAPQAVNPAQIIRDPDFQALSLPDKLTFLSKADSDFAGLADGDKLTFLSKLSQSQQPGFFGRYAQQMVGSAHPIDAIKRGVKYLGDLASPAGAGML